MSAHPPSSSPLSENGENNLQPFFILHKALPQKSSGSGKTRRKIDLSPSSPIPTEKSNSESFQDETNRTYEQLRFEAFNLVWSKIDTTIKGVIRDLNINLFNDVHRWISESFSAIKSSGTCGVSEVNRSYPLVTDNVCIQIFTALILTKNVEIVDDLLTFKELVVHLKSHGCHVANLSSIDFKQKNGIGGCLRSLLRQLVTVTPDVVDMSTIASWYSEPANYDNPLILIIDDMERCNGTILAEFIIMLSEWVIKIPIILVMGVATTLDAPRKLLPSNALQHLQPCTFALGSPIERLDAVIEEIIVKSSFGFDIGYKVAVFLRSYFFRHDGTITSFIRALKIACTKHFSMEPLSFLGKGTFDEDSQGFWNDMCAKLPEVMLKYAFDLPSCKRENIAVKSADSLALGLSELKRLRKNWGSVVMCLYEAGKYQKMLLLDIICEGLDPGLYKSRASDYHLGVGKDFAVTSPTNSILLDAECSGLRKRSFIAQAVRKVRDLPKASLLQLLKIWEKHTEEMFEINNEVKGLHSILGFEDDGKNLKQDAENMRVSTSRSRLNVGKSTLAVNEKAIMLMERMVREYLTPMECMRFHEIVCFKHVDILQSALVGDPRRMIQVDLLKSYAYLDCSCCNDGGSALLPSMHDTSIMYNLAQEHGDLINLHDWYQSFKATVSSSTKHKNKMRQSPMSKRRKGTNALAEANEASIQARFCRAVTELQITGLLRMPSKRRPDYIQRIAFGL